MFTQWNVIKQWELQLHVTIWMSLILKHKRAQISYAVKVGFPLWGGAAASGREQGCGGEGKVEGREKLGEGRGPLACWNSPVS